MKSLNIVSALIFFMTTTSLLAGDKLGVVLMHGKVGTARSGSPIGKLVGFLEENDVYVVAPDMPWHRDRYLEKSYDDSMKEIDKAVEELRSSGATKIVVGGHSMGANAAMGYGARRDGIAGILAIAPGHTPDSESYQSRIENDWQRAKQMVDAGKSGESAGFQDRNQGRNSEIETTAVIYLSWFQPSGPASMATNVANFKPNTPLLWVVGEKDRMYERGEEYAYSNAPMHPKNAYLVVKGGHKVTPKKGKNEILDWLNSL